jgi:hypothetical protein
MKLISVTALFALALALSRLGAEREVALKELPEAVQPTMAAFFASPLTDRESRTHLPLRWVRSF